MTAVAPAPVVLLSEHLRLRLKPEGSPSWEEASLCRETDPEAFFPEKGESALSAKRICNQCPVKSQCLKHALDEDEPFGVWGGMTTRERRLLKRQQPTSDSAASSF